MAISYFKEWFSDPNTEKMAILEVDAFDASTSTVVKKYFSTDFLVSDSFHANNSEEMAVVLRKDISITREAADFGGTRGAIGVSVIELDNDDRSLDPLTFPQNKIAIPMPGESPVDDTRILLEGRKFNLYVGDKNWSFDPSGTVSTEFGIILSGTIDEIKVPDDDTVQLIVTEFLSELDTEIQNRVFKPLVDTDIDEQLRDQFLPLCFGDVKNISPVLIDPADPRGIRFKIHDGPIQAIDSVYIGGDNTGIDLVGDLSEGKNWIENQLLTPTWDSDINLGTPYNAVSTSNSYALLGDREYSSPATNSGKVWSLEWNGTDWSEDSSDLEIPSPFGGTNNVYFGTRIIDIADDQFLISSVSHTDNDNSFLDGGKVFNFLRTGAFASSKMSLSNSYVAGVDYTDIFDNSLSELTIKVNTVIDPSSTGIIVESGGSSTGLVLYAHKGFIKFKYTNDAFSHTSTMQATIPTNRGWVDRIIEVSISNGEGKAELYLDGVSKDTVNVLTGGQLLAGGNVGGIAEVHGGVAPNDGGWTTDGEGVFSDTINSVDLYYDQVIFDFVANSWVSIQELDRLDFSSPPAREFLAFGIEMDYEDGLLAVGGGLPEEFNFSNDGGLFLYDYDSVTKTFSPQEILTNEEGTRFGSQAIKIVNKNEILLGKSNNLFDNFSNDLLNYIKEDSIWKVKSVVINDVGEQIRDIDVQGNFAAYIRGGDSFYNLTGTNGLLKTLIKLNNIWQLPNNPVSIGGSGYSTAKIFGSYVIRTQTNNDFSAVDWIDILPGGSIVNTKTEHVTNDSSTSIIARDFDINNNGYVTIDGVSTDISLSTVEPDPGTSSVPTCTGNSGFVTDLKNGEFFLCSNPGPFPVTCDVKGALKMSSADFQQGFTIRSRKYSVDTDPPLLTDTTTLSAGTSYFLTFFNSTDILDEVEYIPEKNNPTVGEVIEEVNKLLTYFSINYIDNQGVIYFVTRVQSFDVIWVSTAGPPELINSVFGSVSVDVFLEDFFVLHNLSNIIKEILTTYGGKLGSDLDITSIDQLALDLPMGGVGGIYIKNNENILEILDKLLLGLNRFYGINFDGKFYIGDLNLPSSDTLNEPTIADTIISDYIDDIEISRELNPVKSVQINYNKNWTAFPELQNIYSDAAFNSGDAPITGNIWENMPERLNFLSNEWRTLEKSDGLIADKFPSAKILKDIDIYLTFVEEAQQILDNLFDVASDKRYKVSFEAPRDLYLTNNLGTDIFIQTPRFNFVVRKGKLFKIEYNIFDPIINVEVLI